MTQFSIQKKELISWANNVLSLCREENDETAVSMIEEAIYNYEAERLIISIMGLAKRGKSTLINAFLGRNDDTFAPIDKLPATSASTSFTWDQSINVEAVMRNGNIQRISPDEIRSYVTEEENPENVKEVAFVRASGPFSDRLRGMTIVDLPGAGSIHEHHDQIIHQFLPQSDAVLLLTTARMPINEDELGLLREVRKADIKKIFIAINKVDVTEENELRECEIANGRSLASVGINSLKMHKISAKKAYEGDWNASGLDNLWEEIGEFLSQNRAKIMNGKLVSRVLEAAGPLVQGLATQLSSSKYSIKQLESERLRLASEKKEIERNRGINEREFLKRWDDAVDQVEMQIQGIKQKVSDIIQKKIEKASMTSLDKLEKEMPSFFAKTMEEELGPVFGIMEGKFRDISQEFQVESENVFLDKTKIKIEGTETAKDLVTGTLTTGALVGGGAAFATIAGAATTTAVVPVTATVAAGTAATVGGGILSTLGNALGLGFISSWGASLAAPATVATTATVTVPSTLALVAGPIGWTVVGIGACALPIAWAFSRRKKRRGVREEMNDNIEKVFSSIKNEKIPLFRKIGRKTLEEIRINIDRRLIKLDEALEKAIFISGDQIEIKHLENKHNKMQNLIQNSTLLLGNE